MIDFLHPLLLASSEDICTLTFFIVFTIQSPYKSLLKSSYIMQTPKHFTLHNTWKYQSIIHKTIMSLPLSILFSFASILLFALPLQAAFLSPVRKDHTTLQYTLPILLKTPPQPTQLVLDLGGSFSWVNCYNNYTSSTYHHIFCDTPLCTYTQSFACGNCYDKPFGPNCANNTCDLFPENPIIRDRGLDSVGLDDALTDTLALPTTDGKAQGPLGFVKDFIFSCAKASLLKKLAKGATGMAGLGRSNISLQAQVSDSFSRSRYFALCLSGSTRDPGVAFFGTGGPYHFLPNIDLSSYLIYTPLLVNPTGSTIIVYPHPSDEYYIGLTSILVNGKIAPINGSLLAIDESGFGGTKISTVDPYTVLQSSIYKAVTEAFVKESAAFNLTVTKPVKPFNVCYPAGQIMSSPVGPRVPTVDLVLHGKNVVWRIYGSNSMVRIRKKGLDLWCLGFVDGGTKARTSIVIGGHQIEDNLLQFDLKSNQLGLTSSILVHGTTCAHFNFTAKSMKI